MLIAVTMVLSSSLYDWFSNLERKHFYESELERKRENLEGMRIVTIKFLTYQNMSKVA